MDISLKFGFVCMLVAVLAFQAQLLRMKKQLAECLDSKAAIDVLADQVCELSNDFYGPEYK